MSDAGPSRGPVHVHCGDCAAAVARAAGLAGEVLPWRDSSAVGPCAVDPVAHRRLRADWWDVAQAEMQMPADLPAGRDLVLWFGPDPWEQIALVEVLDGAPRDALSLVPLDQGVGLMEPGRLAERLAARVDARDLPGALRGLWRDFCADDRPALRRWVDRLRDEPRLPHFPAALARVLEDRDGGRSEAQVRALVSQGVTELPELMTRLQALEDPRHGVWYGDVVVRRLRARVAAGA